MRHFILGTDWWTDCDDAVAIRLLARAHKLGQIRLDGIIINACMKYSVRSLDAFLRSHGVDDIPIGIDSDATDYRGNPPYQKRLAELSSKYESNTDAENPVRLYRRILANALEPVEILEIGFLQVVAALIESCADDISPKSGIELISEKVSKFWVMAGKWDEQHGIENNFAQTERARVAASKFCEKCPVPVTFLGFEVGESVITGNTLNDDDILRQVLVDHGSAGGRMSWDPMLALLALIGNESDAGYDTVVGVASVKSDDGSNTFLPVEGGKHKYVIKNRPDGWYKKAINDLIK